jgi:hypothetical protein
LTARHIEKFSEGVLGGGDGNPSWKNSSRLKSLLWAETGKIGARGNQIPGLEPEATDGGVAKAIKPSAAVRSRPALLRHEGCSRC